MGLVYGVGYNSENKPCYIAGKPLVQYTLWTNMLRRCYCDDYLIEKPSYKNCLASEKFKDYSYFYEWCQKQIGFNDKGFQLDKDLLIKNNKLYGEDTCVFIPKEINMSLIMRKSARGKYPIGVSFDKKTDAFRARYSDNGVCKLIGYFDNQFDAFDFYKLKKEEYIKYMAEKYKDKIDIKAYRALINYTVEITD